MAHITKQLIKGIFVNEKPSTQKHYDNIIDSFWHKDDKIPVDYIEGQIAGGGGTSFDPSELEQKFNTKVDALNVAKVDKVNGKGLSEQNFTLAEKTKLSQLQLIDVSTKLESGGYTGTAKQLKTEIDNIVTLLDVDDANLTNLQKIVDFVKSNAETLDALSIDGIAGLRTALNDIIAINVAQQQKINELEAELASHKTSTELALQGKANANHSHSYDSLSGVPQNLVTEAPKDNNSYVRKNGAWQGTDVDFQSLDLLQTFNNIYES